jgi:glycosyltransferase involved in cell wall biosynthesis
MSSKNVDYYIANSKIIATRIKKAYDRQSIVIYPPVDVDKYRPDRDVTKKDFYLSAGRLIPYKKVDLIVRAFNKTDKKLIVAGTGPELAKIKEIAKDNIEFAGFVSDKKLVSLYQEARGFIFAANEDFGIVPVEAMSAGTPVIAFGKGGATETIVSNKTGVFFEEQSTASLTDAVERFEQLKILPSSCIKQAENFSREHFKNNIKKFVTKVIGERNEHQ